MPNADFYKKIQIKLHISFNFLFSDVCSYL